MYPELIQELKQRILHKFQEDLEKLWIAVNSAEINEKVYAQLETFSKQCEPYNQKGHPVTREQVISLEEKIKEYTKWMPAHQNIFPTELNITSDADYYLNKHKLSVLQPKATEFYNKIKEEYLDLFVKEYWQAISSRISSQFDSFNPENILEQFLNRHPWLHQDLNIAREFLAKVMNKAFNELYFIDSGCSWKTRDSGTLNELNSMVRNFASNASWNPINNKTLAIEIEVTPYSNIRSEYYYREHHFPCLDTDIGALHSKAPSDFSNYSVKRVDMLRHITRYYPSKVTPYPDDLPAPASLDELLARAPKPITLETETPKLAPYIADELHELSVAQLNCLENMLINIGTEAEPMWISMHKPNENNPNHWDVYIPQFLQAQVKERLASFIQSGKSVTIKTVDYTNNANQNDIESMGDLTKWHSVLLGRVLPWQMQSNPQEDLSTYRKDMPISLFFEYALKSFRYEHSRGYPSLDRYFSRRKPFSDASFKDLFYLRAGPNFLLANPSFFEGDKREETLLKAFDDAALRLSSSVNDNPLPDSLSLGQASQPIMKQALFVLYHNQNLSKLWLPSIKREENLAQLINLNTNLLTAGPINLAQLKEKGNYLPLAMACAARNRFLNTVLEQNSWDKLSEISERPNLWNRTGRELFQFFQNQDGAINLDFINEFESLNSQWSPLYFDHHQRPQSPHLQPIWAFAQIAQMGTQGLDVLFDYIEKNYVINYKGFAPNLPAVFNVVGSLTDEPGAYLGHLITKIKTIGDNPYGCSPLFKSLSLILPPSINIIEPQLLELFKIVHQQKLKYKDAVNEITLHPLDIKNHSETKNFLDKIEQLANDKASPLQILIHIPAWDRASFSDKKECELKAQYKKIQNQILENQRQAKFAEFTANAQNLLELEKNKVVPEVLIEEHAELKPQPWDGDDVSYPLTSQTPGVQQQLQQAIEQEYQQEHKQVVKPEPDEPEQVIPDYNGDEAVLITRSNIDANAYCVETWGTIPPATKHFSGWNTKELKQLFSVWVGSDLDATSVIKKIEPAAIKKIMEYAPSFRLGVFPNNLPAGFSLAYSRQDKGLILCFDPRREKEELKSRTRPSLAKRNPFTVQCYDPMPALIFRGDFRQLSPLSTPSPISKRGDFGQVAPLTELQKLMWNYVATDAEDQQRVDNAMATLEKLHLEAKPEHASLQMQEFTVFKTVSAEPEGYNEALLALKAWAKNKLKDPQDVLNALFDKESTAVLSVNNLKAFGQLFYAHEVTKLKKETKNASEHFLIMAQQIHNRFGAQHFATWKKYVVDPSQNFCECLTKEEVDAVTLSIVTLKNQPALQNIWWALIKAHGEATGFTRYGPLWYSFQKLLAYAEKYELIINEKSMLNYLSQATDFQAQVFLDRLYQCLRASEKELLTQEIQQNILDHVDEIDWHHNGFYYATHYEKYPYWSKSLNLSGFADQDAHAKASYLPKMDDNPSNIVLSSLRYLSQRMRILTTDYARLQEIIEQRFVQSKLITTANGPLILRLLISCLSQGLDRAPEMNDKLIAEQVAELAHVDTDILNWLNKNIRLDDKIISGSLHIKFTHLASLCQAIKNSGMKEELLQLDLADVQQFINNCGRALQCFSSNYVNKTWLSASATSPTEAFTALLKTMRQHKLPINTPLLSTYPWLFFDSQEDLSWIDSIGASFLEEKELLEKQLKSIDFDRCTYLPTPLEFTNVDPQLPDSKATRIHFVNQQIKKGCAITYRDARSRPLNYEEQKIAYEYTTKHLKTNFRTQNVVLCEKFFKECVAVEVEGGAQKKNLEQLLRLLTRIDNKLYYNDLGQVLGLLIKKKGPQQYYSLEQLTSYLECLIDPVHADKDHYPINMLATILDFQSPTLLNSDLDQLQKNIHPEALKNTLTEIARSNVPNQYKPVLTKYALHHPSDAQFIEYARATLQNLHQNGMHSQWIKEISHFITSITDVNNPLFQERNSIIWQCSVLPAQIQMNQRDLSSKDIQRLENSWQESQIKLIELYQTKEKNFLTLFKRDYLPTDAYIQMIILKVLKDTDKFEDINKLKTQLRRFPVNELRNLALYCHSSPTLSINSLNQLTEKETNTIRIIHQFETVMQAQKIDGTSKRHYSITSKENADLRRVFQGLKQKGKGLVPQREQKKLLELVYYVNAYSQVAYLSSITAEELNKELNKHRQILINDATPPEEKSLTSARLLACMREMLLRKTGKWVNHTQMLDLIYAAEHNNESLLHQVRTGQGKSIISMMRVAYLALNGNVVDIFSSKDSLSQRDQEEFSHVLEAMGIRNSYITPQSPAEDYQTNDSTQNIGVVNFCTIGNASLFQSTQIWQHNKNIDLDPKLRVAFVDECDFVLKFENTQFNYSANSDATAIYNFDEWVYRVAYKYYLENKDHFQSDNGVMRISRNKHLKQLCDRILQEMKSSPKQSTFVEQFITPAAEGDPQAIEKRDNQLKKLLVAAHTAQNLQVDVHFSIRPDQQIVGQRTVINSRFAKVLIGNQIKHGSTYSELAQQFLHVRLNEEAIAKGESPNFFVEPDSQVALSSNAKYDLQKRYKKIEGCTGTAGNKEDLKLYADTFGIKHVVKLPAHEELRTDFLGGIYCDNKKSQIEQIIAHLNQYSDRPILITCEDDIEVKKIAKLIEEQQGARYNPDLFIIDTNDSGLAESDILPRAGAAGRVVISSRMGRGTDIKPETEAGLMVLRTYPALPQIVKQELGRQGRNGAKGTCIDIIDYSDVLKDLNSLQEKDSPYQSRIAEIINEERTHLEEKLQKHRQASSKKWDWLTDSEKEKYLITRSVQRLKYEIGKQKEMYLRRKEFLMASLSGHVTDILRRQFENQQFKLDEFKKDWLVCCTRIEDLWNTRLAGKAGDSEEVYAEFKKHASSIWEDYCQGYAELNKSLVLSPPPPPHSKPPMPAFQHKHDPMSPTEFQAIILFYQEWVNAAQEHYFSAGAGAPPAGPWTIDAIYGTNRENLNIFFQTLYSVSHSQAKEPTELLFKNLAAQPKQQLLLIPLNNLTKTIALLSQKSTHADFEQHLTCLDAFFKLDILKDKHPRVTKPSDLKKIGLLLNTMMEIATGYFVEQDTNGGTIALMNQLSQCIYDDFWDVFDENLAQDLVKVFASSKNAATLLSRNILHYDLHHLVKVINQNKTATKRNERIAQLGDYLKDDAHHQALLDERMGVVRPLFNMVLEDSAHQELNYLPPPHVLEGLTAEKQSQFWDFIAQRQPITQRALERLIRILHKGINIKDFESQIFTPMIQLPPYVSIQYITERIEGRISKTNCTDARIALADIEEATKAFTFYARQTGIITSDLKYSRKTNPMYDDSVTLFTQMTPTENKRFFTLCADYTKLPPKSVHLIGSSWAKNNFAEQEKLLTLGVEVINTPEQCQESVLNAYNRALSTKEKLAPVQLFINKIKSSDIHDPAFDIAWNAWPNKQIDSEKAIGEFYQFLTAVKNKNINIETMKKLANAWFSKQIIDETFLKEIIETIVLAQSLSRKQNWSDYFNSIHTNKKPRENIMQLLHHGILDLGRDFSEKCYADYQHLILKEIKQAENLSQMTPPQRHTSLTSSFKKIVSFSQELVNIDKDIHSPSAPPKKTTFSDMKHKTFFKTYQDAYQKTWWKNETREAQAIGLFSSLGWISTNEKVPFYQESLNIIWRTQQDILESDKNTNRNTKGYSRLYDITVQMSIHLIREYLADPDISVQDKIQLNNTLNPQLEYQIQLLASRLPKNHQYTNLLKSYNAEKMRPGSIQLATFQEEFQTIKRENIPKNLRYIFTNIECFMDATTRDGVREDVNSPKMLK